MFGALRHVLAIVALPFTVTVVIPFWIGGRYRIAFQTPYDVVAALSLAVGALALLGGLLLFSACLARFAKQGCGTLAPWDPPRHLVVSGPYRYVRHPMISGVIAILTGEALVLRSAQHGAWALAFLVFNLVYIPLFEEPQLAARFGTPYRKYQRQVPALLPRLRPWIDD